MKHRNRFYISILIVLYLIAQGCSPTNNPKQPTVSPDFRTQVKETPLSSSTENPGYVNARNNMVERQIIARGISDPLVLEAMRTVPRHKFVPDEYLAQAYADHPLPIGYGQTISQPYIVALMTEVLQLKPGEKVLEIGTGSGYQAAVLAQMGMDVYTVEIIPQLAEEARIRFSELGYHNIHTVTADGYFGWLEYAPYDAIIVTAAPDHLPPPLAEQLVTGGRMVIPIGPIGAVQTLWLFTKNESGLMAENLGPVRFVPLTRNK